MTDEKAPPKTRALPKKIEICTTNSRGNHIEFGTTDLRDLTDDDTVLFTVARVYRFAKTELCRHRHRTRKAAIKCARSMALGSKAGAGKSHVEIRSVEP